MNNNQNYLDIHLNVMKIITNDESNESLGGHYTTSVKIDANCWQEISDSECSYRKYLPKYLENVYMLLLEKL